MDTNLGPFVETIRNFDCLWNPADKQYYDASAREAAWLEIVEKHNLPDVATAKRGWKALRDTHREVMKRHWSSVAKGIPRQKPWKYFEDMEFLVPHIGGRPKNQRYSFQHKNYEKDDMGIEVVQVKTEKENCEEPDEKAAKRRKTRSHKSEEFEPGMICETELTELQSGSDKSRDDVSFFRQPAPTECADPMTKFFGAMCDTARQLPEIYQLEIKKKLFQAVSDAEERYLKSRT